MTLNLVALVVHPEKSAITALTQRLYPEIQFMLVDYAHTLPDGFQSLLEKNYHICFIHSSYTAGLGAFFSDMHRAGKDATCLFVQMWDMLPDDFNEAPALEAGFSTVISQDVTKDDREALKELLRIEMHRQEVTQRVQDVRQAIEFLVKELDRTARERHRGRQKKLDQLIRSFISSQTDFDAEILDDYFRALTEHTEATVPFRSRKLKVPRWVLKRSPPNLSKDTYTGISCRVWLKMLEKFGAPVSEKEEMEDDSDPERKDRNDK